MSSPSQNSAWPGQLLDSEPPAQIHAVFNTSLATLSLTLITIATTIILGWYGGKLLGISKDLSILIAAGTAICGASAIAAVGAAIKAKPGDLTVALAVILMFNTIALFLFPRSDILWDLRALSLPCGQE